MNLSNVEIPYRWDGDIALYAQMKILIIDDERVNVALLEDLRAESGY